VDGQVGYSYRTVLDYSDTAKGRNPVYVAFGSPGRIMRLQPVPVDRQVEEMLSKHQVSAAQDLLVNTAPSAEVLAAKLNRLRIDSGRVLLYRLDFEAAFAQLGLSSIDPREVLTLFPELQISVAGTTAAALPEPPLGSVPADIIRRAYRFPCRYLHAGLSAGIVEGSRAPADAASEAADASSSAAAAAAAAVGAGAGPGFEAAGSRGHGGAVSAGHGTAAAGSAALFGPSASASTRAGGAPARGDGLEPGMRSSGPDIAAIVRAQLPAFAQRVKEEDAARAEATPHSPPPKRHPTLDERLAVCYEALLLFLRGRRAALLRWVRGDGDGEGEGGAGGLGASSASMRPGGGGLGDGGSLAAARGAAASAGAGGAGGPALSPAASGRVPTDVAARLVATSSYAPRNLSDEDVDALFLALDTAIMKLLYRTQRWRHLDLFLFRCPFVDLPDATAFLRGVGKYHSAALLYQGRGMVRQALEAWRELGTSAVLEYRERVRDRAFSSASSAGGGAGGGLGAGSAAAARGSRSLLAGAPGSGTPSGASGRDADADGSRSGRVDSLSDDELADWPGPLSGEEEGEAAPPPFSAASGASAASATVLTVSRNRAGSRAVAGGRARRGTFLLTSPSAGSVASSGSLLGTGGPGSASNAAFYTQRRPSALGMASSTDGASAAAPGTGTAASSFGATATGGAGGSLPPALRQYYGNLATLSGGGAGTSSATSAGGGIDKYSGVEDSVELLRGESDPGLVFEFAEWLLLRAPAKALAVFTEGTRSAPFAHDTVLQYLRSQRFVQAARLQPGAPSPARLFLEWLVYGLGRTEERFHTQLACEYIAAVVILRGEDAAVATDVLPAGSAAAAGNAAGFAAAAGKLGISAPSSAIPLSLAAALSPKDPLDRAAALSGPRKLARPPPGTEGGTLGQLRCRLLHLLQDSCFYDAEQLQAAIGTHSVWEERVVLHARRRQHAAALAVLVRALGDHAAAVRYCAMLSRRLFGEGSAAAGDGLAGSGGGGSAGGDLMSATPTAGYTGAGFLSPVAGSSSSSTGRGSGAEDAFTGIAGGSAGGDGAAGGGGGASSGSDAFPLLLDLYLQADAELKETWARAGVSPAAAAAAGGADSFPLAGKDGGPLPQLQGPVTPYLRNALDILSRFAAYVNPLSVAQLIPADIPLSALLPYWSTALPASQHRAREALVQRHLYRHLHLAVHAELVRLQQRHAVIDRGSSCFVCDKRIDDAVFSVLPDGQVLHYGCLRELSNTYGAALGRHDHAYGARRLGLVPRAPGAILSANALAAAAAEGAGADDTGLGDGGVGLGTVATPVRDPSVDVLPLYPDVPIPDTGLTFRRFRQGAPPLPQQQQQLQLRGAASAPAGSDALRAIDDAALSASAAQLACADPSTPSMQLSPLPLPAYVQTKVLRLGGPGAGFVTSQPQGPAAGGAAGASGGRGVMGTIAGGLGAVGHSLGSAASGVTHKIGAGVGAIAGGVGAGVGAIAGGVGAGVGAIAGGIAAVAHTVTGSGSDKGVAAAAASALAAEAASETALRRLSRDSEASAAAGSAAGMAGSPYTPYGSPSLASAGGLASAASLSAAPVAGATTSVRLSNGSVVAAGTGAAGGARGMSSQAAAAGSPGGDALGSGGPSTLERQQSVSLIPDLTSAITDDHFSGGAGRFGGGALGGGGGSGFAGLSGASVGGGSGLSGGYGPGGQPLSAASPGLGGFAGLPPGATAVSRAAAADRARRLSGSSTGSGGGYYHSYGIGSDAPLAGGSPYGPAPSGAGNPFGGAASPAPAPLPPRAVSSSAAGAGNPFATADAGAGGTPPLSLSSGRTGSAALARTVSSGVGLRGSPALAGSSSPGNPFGDAGGGGGGPVGLGAGSRPPVASVSVAGVFGGRAAAPVPAPAAKKGLTRGLSTLLGRGS